METVPPPASPNIFFCTASQCMRAEGRCDAACCTLHPLHYHAPNHLPAYLGYLSRIVPATRCHFLPTTPLFPHGEGVF